MKAIVAALIAMAAFLATAPPAAAGPRDPRITPPSRPIPVSVAQFDVLQRLSSQPEHARVLAQRAAYSPKAARTMTEIGVRATQIAIPGTILTLLIAAAPL